MRKKVFFTAVIISAALCAALIFSSCTKEVSATVDKNAATVEVSQDLYGLFLEDISFAGDGGLISELVNNKSFEYEYDHTAYWRFSDLQAYTDANEYSMNENNSNYLRVSVNGKGTALNLGYVEFYDDMTANYNKEKKNTPDMGFVQGEYYYHVLGPDGQGGLFKYAAEDFSRDLAQEEPERYEYMKNMTRGLFETSKYLLYHNQKNNEQDK